MLNEELKAEAEFTIQVNKAIELLQDSHLKLMDNHLDLQNQVLKLAKHIEALQGAVLILERE